LGHVDEMNLYLNTEPENVADPIQWWYEKRKTYPRLHQMAIDYLTIPGVCLAIRVFIFTHGWQPYIATSVDVERLFSRGRLILSHTRSRLSVLSTRALLCLGSWGHLGLVKDEDVEAVAKLSDEDAEMELNNLKNVFTG
jgi:hypothetical protein